MKKKNRNNFEGRQFEHVGDIAPVEGGAFIGEMREYDFDGVKVHGLNWVHAEYIYLLTILKESNSRFNRDRACDNCGAGLVRAVILRDKETGQSIAVGIDCGKLIFSGLDAAAFDRRQKEREIKKCRNGAFLWSTKIKNGNFWDFWKSGDRPRWLRVSKVAARDARGRHADGFDWYMQIWGDTKDEVAHNQILLETYRENFKF
jgi:hypothetical protein